MPMKSAYKKFRGMFRRSPKASSLPPSTNPSQASSYDTADQSHQANAALTRHGVTTVSMLPSSITTSTEQTSRVITSTYSPPAPLTIIDYTMDGLTTTMNCLKGVGGLVPGLAPAASIAAELLSKVANGRQNDGNVKAALQEISGFILVIDRVTSRGSKLSEDLQQDVAEIQRTLEEVRKVCQEYDGANRFNKITFSSSWKLRLDEVRKSIANQLQLFILLNTMSVRTGLEGWDTDNPKLHDAMHDFIELLLDKMDEVAKIEQVNDQAYKHAQVGVHAQIRHGGNYGFPTPFATQEIRSQAFTGAKIDGQVESYVNSAQGTGGFTDRFASAGTPMYPVNYTYPVNHTYPVNYPYHH